MLRESGRSGLGAAPPQCLPTVTEATALSALSMPAEGICCVRAIKADGQSGWFNLCDLVCLSSCPGQRLKARPGCLTGCEGELCARGHRRLMGQGQRKLLTGWHPVSLAPHNPQVTEILICPKALQLTESCSTDASDILLKIKGKQLPPLYLTFHFWGRMRESLFQGREMTWESGSLERVFCGSTCRAPAGGV